MMTQTLTQSHSWVIVEIATGAVIFETYNPKVAAAINTRKYRAVPILEYLQNFNRRIRIDSV
jgi:hypothetical protein